MKMKTFYWFYIQKRIMHAIKKHKWAYNTLWFMYSSLFAILCWTFPVDVCFVICWVLLSFCQCLCSECVDALEFALSEKAVCVSCVWELWRFATAEIRQHWGVILTSSGFFSIFLIVVPTHKQTHLILNSEQKCTSKRYVYLTCYV